jgi:hypothetical protein
MDWRRGYPFSPSVVDRHVLALEIADLSKASVESSYKCLASRIERSNGEEPDYGHPTAPAP